MSANSIIRNLDKDTTFSEMKLLLAQPQIKQGVLVVVEGNDDCNLISKFLSSKAIVVESYSGCNGVKQLVLNDFLNNKNVIGICDRDYDELINNEKLFYYDYSTLEIMIIRTPDIFESICSEYYIGQLKHIEIFTMILKRLKIVSFFRKINTKNDIGINFNVLRYNTIIQLTELDAWNRAIVNMLEEKNANISQDFFEQNFLDFHSTTWSEEELLMNTNGHDFFFLLNSFFQMNRQINNCNAAILEKIARCAYNRIFFRNSDLYYSLKKYEMDNRIEVLDSNI